ncbi:DUF4007 family protein [Kitasatospora hibisci]|uniref:DUF4007 family protein n=1 Tax=Kitasatospora hibisci TaxID=3369522 RepID=UPI00375455A4
MSDSRLAEAANYAFARHDTFAPRFGWLHKAYVQVKQDPETFLRNDAPVLLGVGKNMAVAMRYWSKAFKLTRESYSDETNSRAMRAYPTWEARWLLDEDGADPYLEEHGSLWLLHWWLVSSRPGAKSWAPSWYVAFQLAPFARFTAADLTQLIVRHVNLSYKKAPEEASIAKDVDCITKMYVPVKRTTKGGAPGALEDLVLGPFRELGLIEVVDRPMSGRTEWEFTTGTRITLPDRVVAYACLDYAASTAPGAGSISLARLANESGGPGRAFRIREPDIAAALERVTATTPNLKVIEAVGQRSLVFDTDPFELAWDILDAQYDNVRKRPGFPTRDAWDRAYPKLADAEARELEQEAEQQLPLNGDDE